MNATSTPISANLSTSSMFNSSEIINPNTLSLLSHTNAQLYERVSCLRMD